MFIRYPYNKPERIIDARELERLFAEHFKTKIVAKLMRFDYPFFNKRVRDSNELLEAKAKGQAKFKENARKVVSAISAV